MGNSRLIKILCSNCGGGQTNHCILKEHDNNWNDADENDPSAGYDIQGGGTYQIIECQGCSSIRFRQTTWCSEDFDHHTGQVVEEVEVYPEVRLGERKEIGTHYLPNKIEVIYKEAVKAINSNIPMLAAGGIRATVEAICMDKNVKGNLEKKINSLKDLGFLTQAQSDLLHEERFLGNNALHEIDSPGKGELKDGLDIVEGMLNTIYILPIKARRMKSARLERKKDSE